MDTIHRMKAIPMNLLSPVKEWGGFVEQLTYAVLPHWPFNKNLEGLFELSFIHFARWVVFPKKLPHFPGQPEDHLPCEHLYFASNYNGHWDQYIDAFSDALDGGLNGMWRGSINWVPAAQVQGLKRYIRWHQIKHGVVPTDHYYCAYPEASTNDVKTALELCDALAAFKKESEKLGDGETDEAFVGRYQLLLRQVQHCLGSTGDAMIDAEQLAATLGDEFLEPVTPPPFDR